MHRVLHHCLNVQTYFVALCLWSMTSSLMHTSATHVAGRFGIVQLERYNSARVAIFQTDLQRGVAEVALMSIV